MARTSEELVQRLRTLQAHRHEQSRRKDFDGALDTLRTAISCIDPLGLPTLREALLFATNPANTPPLPAVLGPQDVSEGGITVEELLSMVHLYVEAQLVLAQYRSPEAVGACRNAHAALRTAFELLCAPLPPVELSGGRTS